MSVLRFKDIVDEMENVDDPDVLEKAASNTALRHALEISRPENWRGSGLEPTSILAVATDSGIPVAWVPPVAVLRALVAAEPAARMELLLKNEPAVLDHCEALLTDATDPWIAGERTLVQRALAALRAGHHEAAMALAVAVGEPLALWASEPRVKMFDSHADAEAWEKQRRKNKYGLAAVEMAAVGPGTKLRRLEVLRRALIAPIPKFFTPFFGKPGEAVPDTTSRHATVHQPTPSHFSRGNSVLAVMLCTSILREQQAWCEEVRHDDQQGYEE